MIIDFFSFFWFLDCNGCVYHVYNIRFTPLAMAYVMQTQSTLLLQEKGLMSVASSL